MDIREADGELTLMKTSLLFCVNRVAVKIRKAERSVAKHTFSQFASAYSNSTREKDLSSDIEIRVIGYTHVYTKKLRYLNEKLGAEFPFITLGYSVAKTAHHDDSFRGILDLEASPVEGQQLQQKDKKIKK